MAPVTGLLSSLSAHNSYCADGNNNDNNDNDSTDNDNDNANNNDDNIDNIIDRCMGEGNKITDKTVNVENI